MHPHMRQRAFDSAMKVLKLALNSCLLFTSLTFFSNRKKIFFGYVYAVYSIFEGSYN